MTTIFDRVKSYEDACKELNLKPRSLSDYAFLEDDDERNVEFANHCRYRIAKALQENDFLDYTNPRQWKYFARFRYDSASGCWVFYDIFYYGLSMSFIGAGLSFATAEKVTYFGKQFIELHNIALGKGK